VKFSKSSYVLLLVGAVVVAGTINFAFAGPIIKDDSFVSPSQTISGKGGQYALLFTTVDTGIIASIDIDFPSGTLIGLFTRIADFNGIGEGTKSTSGTTLTYTVDTPVSVPGGTEIYLFIAKIENTATTGATTVTVTTKLGNGNTIDTGTLPFGIQFPDAGALEIKDTKIIVNGDIDVTGNIIPTGDICIGTGC